MAASTLQKQRQLCRSIRAQIVDLEVELQYARPDERAGIEYALTERSAALKSALNELVHLEENEHE